ncbi:hypothetical protein [Spirosoma harenae]
MILVYFNEKPIYLYPAIAHRFGLKEGHRLPVETAEQIIHQNAIYFANTQKTKV